MTTDDVRAQLGTYKVFSHPRSSIDMTTTVQLNDNEALRLSAIYRNCLNQIDELYDDNDMVQEGCHHRLPSGQYDQAVEIISQAVGEALAVVGQRCPRCDSTEITIDCAACKGVS